MERKRIAAIAAAAVIVGGVATGVVLANNNSTPVSAGSLIEFGGPPAETSYVYSGSPKTNFDNQYNVLASASTYRGLIGFKAGIPSDAVITSASLSITPSIPGTGKFRVHNSLPFNHMTVTWNNQPKWNTAVIGTSVSQTPNLQQTIKLTGLTRSSDGSVYLGVDYTPAGYIGRFYGDRAGETNFPVLDVNYDTNTTTTTTSTTVPPTTTTSVPGSTTTIPNTTTTTTTPPVGTIKIDGISDGGPDAGHYIPNMAAAIKSDSPNYFMWAGDVRDSGTAAQWNTWKSQYSQLVPISLAVTGNHDAPNASASGGFNSVFATAPLTVPGASACGGFTLSNGWKVYEIGENANCVTPLTAFLATPGNRKIVIMHEPRYSGGSGHGSNSGKQAVWAAMFPTGQAPHAFALFSGHDHDAQLIETAGGVQVVNGCAGAAYYSVSPIAGTLYYSKSSADCTFTRFILGPTSATIQFVHTNNVVAFGKTYVVTP